MSVDVDKVIKQLTPAEKAKIPDHFLNYQTQDEFQNLKEILMRTDAYSSLARGRGGFRSRRSSRRTRRGSRRMSRRRR